MLRGPASRLLQNCVQNDASRIGSKSKRWSGLRIPRERFVDRALKGDELISGSTACTALRNSSLNQDRITRLSGYFQALRSKKEYFHALEDYEEIRALRRLFPVMRNFSQKEGMDKSKTKEHMLPEILPFPVETCNLVDLTHLNALQNMPAVGGSSDNADVIVCIMRDLIYKLWGLHYLGVIHGNLKPQNVLVFEGECMLTSIINDGSDPLEWKAPEQIIYKTQTKASDMFTFGCVLYFCITKGHHPFGDTPGERIQNIIANKMNIFHVEDIADAYHLISRLLSPEPEVRPKANDVFSHPFFEDLCTKIELLTDICEMYPRQYEEVVDELKIKAPILENSDWRSRFLDYSCYCGGRKKLLFEYFKDVFGPRGSPTYFPSIYMGVYEVAYKHYRCHSWFREDEYGENDYPEKFFRPYF